MAPRAVGEDMGYPQLAQLLRRVAAAGATSRGNSRQLFPHMVFNILIGNTDGHERTTPCCAGATARGARAGVRRGAERRRGWDSRRCWSVTRAPNPTLDNALSQVRGPSA